MMARVMLAAILLSALTSLGVSSLISFEKVYVGEEVPDSSQEASLWVDGESIFRRYGTPPTGHPGTPVGFRREGMPPDGMGAFAAGAVTTPNLPQAGFGAYIAMHGTALPGEELGQMFIGWNYEVNVSEYTIAPQLLVWRMRTLNGYRQPQILFSSGSDGFVFYADDGNWANPTPVAKVDTNGIIYARGYALLP